MAIDAEVATIVETSQDEPWEVGLQLQFSIVVNANNREQAIFVAGSSPSVEQLLDQAKDFAGYLRLEVLTATRWQS